MSEVLKIILILAGAYLVWRAISPSNVPGVSNTLALIESRVRQSGLDPNTPQTVHVWNWFYQQVRGLPGIAPEDLGLASEARVTLTEWWQLVQAHGLRGLGTYVVRRRLYD